MIQVLIQVDDEGLLTLSAPQNDTIRVVGALEIAKDIVLSTAKEKAKLVQPAPASALRGLPRNGDGGGTGP